jgi:hypothetical protein
VIDQGHTMYTGDGKTPSFCICCDYNPDNRREVRVCYPHAELHPYQWQSVKLIRPPPANIFNPNVETHTVALPFYWMFYGEEKTCILSWCYWDCVYPSEGGYCGQVLDHTRQNESSIEWYIQALNYVVIMYCLSPYD